MSKKEKAQQQGAKPARKLPDLLHNVLVVAIATLVVGILIGTSVSVLFLPQPAQSPSGDACTAETQALLPAEVASKTEAYINDNLLSAGFTAQNTTASKYNEIFYKTEFEIFDGEQTQPFSALATVDGVLLFIGTGEFPGNYVAYNLNEPVPVLEEPEPPAEEEFSEADLNALSEFVQCLKENGLVIYGATWCGWTMTLVDSLGGLEIVEPIFVDCDQESELCAEKVESGYPTIRINGELHGGSLESRSREALAAATGCEAPVLEGGPAEDTGSGSC